jgi:hypothetical protein
MTALIIASPTVIPIGQVRNNPDDAAALCSGLIAAWRLINTADWAMPVPKPLHYVISPYFESLAMPCF